MARKNRLMNFPAITEEQRRKARGEEPTAAPIPPVADFPEALLRDGETPATADTRTPISGMLERIAARGGRYTPAATSADPDTYGLGGQLSEENFQRNLETWRQQQQQVAPVSPTPVSPVTGGEQQPAPITTPVSPIKKEPALDPTQQAIYDNVGQFLQQLIGEKPGGYFQESVMPAARRTLEEEILPQIRHQQMLSGNFYGTPTIDAVSQATQQWGEKMASVRRQLEFEMLQNILPWLQLPTEIAYGVPETGGKAFEQLIQNQLQQQTQQQTQQPRWIPRDFSVEGPPVIGHTPIAESKLRRGGRN